MKRISAISAARDRENIPMNVSNPAFYKGFQTLGSTQNGSDRVIAKDSSIHPIRVDPNNALWN
jgi:hypothetical protein